MRIKGGREEGKGSFVPAFAWWSEVRGEVFFFSFFFFSFFTIYNLQFSYSIGFGFGF